MREFDNETLKTITTFENLTGTTVRDCIKNDSLYFLIETGKMALAIGKGGSKIQAAEKMFKKQIKVFEWHEDPETFIRNMIPQTKKITIKDDKAVINIDEKQKGAVIGKGGSAIKIIRELLERNSSIKELKVK